MACAAALSARIMLASAAHRQPLAEHHEFGGPGEADALGEEQTCAGVRDDAGVDEREGEVRRLGGEHEIARERE